MKLIYCPDCRDLFRLNYKSRMCDCGKSSGAYRDNGLHAWISGLAIPIGFDNGSFSKAKRDQPESGNGVKFTAFVIPRQCDTIEVLDEPLP